MRMANDRDQALLRSAVSDAAANLLVLRAVARHPRGDRLRRGRAAAGAHDLQRRCRRELLPRSDAVGAGRGRPATGSDREFVRAVVERWRGATHGHGAEDARSASAEADRRCAPA